MQDRFQVISPVDSQIYLERNRPTSEEIENTMDLAQKGQRTWQSTPIEKRIYHCKKILDHFLNHASEIATEISWQMGRPIKYSPFEITGGFKDRAEYLIQIAQEALRPDIIEENSNYKRYISHEPLGVVLVLSPWNYPFLTSVNAVLPALLAGNSIILKHADQVPLTAERYAAACQFAGLPTGVFQYLHASHEQVAVMTRDHRINYVSFTGSVDGGKAVEHNLLGRFLPSGFELGGKDAAYVRSDADLEKAIINTADGAFFNSGQSCCGVERIYVHRSRYDDFIDGFVSETKKLKLGNPLNTSTTLGPMVRKSAAQFVRNQIQDALAAGARALIKKDDFPDGDIDSAYLAPQVLINTSHEMAIMQEETFGPVVSITAVDSDEEAIRLISDSKYGLTASIWTNNMDKAEEIGAQLRVGTCFMNRCDYLDPALPWSGVKYSGKGVTLSKFGFLTFTQTKSYHLRR